MTQNDDFRPVAIELKGGAWLHYECFMEATKCADSPYRGRPMETQSMHWRRGCKCAVCGGKTAKVMAVDDRFLPKLGDSRPCLTDLPIANRRGYIIAASPHGTIAWVHKHRRNGQYIRAALSYRRANEFLSWDLHDGHLSSGVLVSHSGTICEILGVDKRSRRRLATALAMAYKARTTLLIGITEENARTLPCEIWGAKHV